MNAIRTYAEVKDHVVKVKLPRNIKSKKVEIIIIPLEAEDDNLPNEGGLSDLQKLLLEAPTMSDEEYDLIMEKRKALNQWS